MIWLYWLAYWISGFALMLAVWWWHGHNLTLSSLAEFAFGTLLAGPFMVALFYWARWRENAPRRDPVVLIRGRGK